MHSVSASSSRVSVTQPENRLNWGCQLGKSVVLAASSVGLGWLISKLWQGVDEPPIMHTGNSGQLTLYKETQNGSHWSTVVTSYVEQAERYEPGFDSETLFQKVDITYRASDQERGSVTTTSNYHVLSACSLVGGLLMGGNIQLPLMVPLLALSMSKSVEALNYVDDNPVGTVIAYASKKLPEGYLRCNGELYSKDKYPELYDVLGEEYRVGGGSFKIPDFEGLFLRGTNDVSEIGKKFEYTTGAPRNNPFKAKDSGEHAHQSVAAGGHDHTVSSAGNHKHKIKVAGEHSHNIQDAGNHKHLMDVIGPEGVGDHTTYAHLLKVNAGQTATKEIQDHTGPGPKGLPNLCAAGSLSGTQSGGLHSHAMDKAGTHHHEMDEIGEHQHEISLANPHSHEIRSGGSHTHEVVGGDAETSPKNIKVAYLIKAKRSENGSPAGTSTDGFITSQSVVMSLVTATFAFFVARMRK